MTRTDFISSVLFWSKQDRERESEKALEMYAVNTRQQAERDYTDTWTQLCVDVCVWDTAIELSRFFYPSSSSDSTLAALQPRFEG